MMIVVRMHQNAGQLQMHEVAPLGRAMASHTLTRTMRTKARQSMELATDDTSSASDSTGECDAVEINSKKRKVTYYKRKDEIEILQDQIKQLKAQLSEAQDRQLTDPRLPEGTRFSNIIEFNNLRLAGTQSMLSAYNMSHSIGATPLKVHIHLPVDSDERARILALVREVQLGSSHRFMIERTRFLDLRIPHRQRETFDLGDGEIMSSGVQVAVFDPRHSLRDVYKELVYFTYHLEIVLSEAYGIIMIRETEQTISDSVHARFLAILPDGSEVEMNTVMCARYVEATADTPGYVIATTCSVDEDELYPIQSESRGRLDFTGVIMLTELDTAGETTIALAGWSHVRFIPPASPISKGDESIAKRLVDWCELIPTTMKDTLATRTPSTPSILETSYAPNMSASIA